MEILKYVRGILQNGLNASFDLEDREINRLSNAIKSRTLDILRDLFKTDKLRGNVNRRFNKDFKEDNGKPRNWIALEEPNINEIWAASKAKLDKLFPKFRTVSINFDFLAGMDPDSSLSTHKSGGDDAAAAPTKAEAMSQTRLLSEQDMARVKDNFA